MKKLRTHSNGSPIGQYSTLAAAMGACNGNTNCFLVYDHKCDGQYYTTEETGTLSKSQSGSCVWIKEGKYRFN